MLLLLPIAALVVIGPVMAESPSLSGEPVPYGDLDRIARDQTRAISNEIDRLVLVQLQQRGTEPNATTSDETFLRRIYLDVVGRIPTLEEARRFLDDPAPDKREALIDQLLQSPGYVSHYFNFWADLLRIKQRNNGGNIGQPYIDYVKTVLRDNKPYDEFVWELITADGPLMERGNGAVGYYLRDFGMPEDNMSNTVRVFLGTRLECAQCHDHPFDAWTQMDYFRMVAFTGGVETRLQNADTASRMAIRRLLDDKNVSQQTRQALRRITRPLTMGVEGSGTGVYRLPEDYQYGDGKPNQVVTAKAIFGENVELDVNVPRDRNVRGRRGGNQQRQRNVIPGAKEVGSREVYADWLTSPDNPRFTTVIANRLWKHALGVGLIEPVDDMNDTTEASNPALMQYLQQQMVALDYDMKQYLRAIFYSQTYQRQATAHELAEGESYAFVGPLLRRMTAEQLWDSLLTLAVPDLDSQSAPAQGVPPIMLGEGDIYDMYAKLRAMSPEELVAFAADEKGQYARMRKLRQAAMNPTPNEADDQRGRMRAMMVEKMRELRDEMNVARRKGDTETLERLEKMRADFQTRMRDVAMGALPRATRETGYLARASELPSPARPGHFVREFGQSDREQIDNAFREPAVTQVLSLMNGFIETQLSRDPRTLLMRNVAAAEIAAEKIDVVYLSMLGRHPDADETQMWLDDARQYGNDVASDIIWTLANAHEFMFVQ
ncbi:MAG: DUF1549 domain-containing protein [Pirellulaceae bacterium]